MLQCFIVLVFQLFYLSGFLKKEVMSLQQAKNNGFNLAWENTNKNATDSKDGFFEMRTWQKRAFHALKEKRFMILNAPMGSGKSWLMCMLSVFKLKQDPSLRCIITVPQTVIASGFINGKFIMPDGGKKHWRIKNNLCSDSPDKGTINYFKKWLEQSSKEFADRIIISTHATLIATYKKLKAENRLHLLDNLLLWIDEAHHIKNVLADDLDGVVINNGLGEVVTYFLNYASNIQLGLTTASFFRGDRASLLTDSMEEQFERFNLPYDEYLGSMKYLKSFSFNFLLSGHDYIQGINLLIGERKGKDIIYIPHPVSQYSTGNKYQEVNNIIGIYGDEFKTSQTGVTVIRGKERDLKILDLVSETQRKQKKNYLDSPTLKIDKDSLDTIITLGMFKEGANWIHADRCIIVGSRTSLVDVIQMVGRLFRDAPGKSHVEVIQVLPFSLDQANEQKFTENLNNYLKAIYASLLLENILNPVKIKAISKTEKKDLLKNSDNNDTDKKTNWLSAELPDDAKQLALLEEIGNSLLDITQSNKNVADDMPTLYAEFQKVMPEILTNHGINEHHEEIVKQIWGTLVRRTMQMQGIDVENIDFNIIQKMNPLGFLTRYTSGVCGLNTFEQLREAINTSRPEWMPFEEARKFVHELKLSGKREWRKYIAGKMKHLPELSKNIPKSPDSVYQNHGWISWGDWLGTNSMAPVRVEWMPFEEARKFVHALKLSGEAEWRKYIAGKMKHLSELPVNIPKTPFSVYQYNGWISWGDWFGTNSIAPGDYEFCSFEEVKNYVQSLGLNSKSDWEQWKKSGNRADDIPATPDKVYRDQGWISWGDFLGTNYIAPKNREFKTFEEAREFIKKYKFKSIQEYFTWARSEDKPNDIPGDPADTYKNKGWTNWGDFLGHNYIAHGNREYRSFEEARIFTRSLNLKSDKEWRDWCKTNDRPEDIPAAPWRTYKKTGWIGLGDWLGHNRPSPQGYQFRTYVEARQYIQSLKFKRKQAYTDWAKTADRPPDIPASPSNTYKNKGWMNWGDFLGHQIIATRNRKFKPFEAARSYVRSLKFKRKQDYTDWSKTDDRPLDIPASPPRTYADKWISWADWLGY